MMVEELGKALFVNDFYEFRIDRYNFFIYHPVVSKMEQRTDLKRTCVQVKPRASLCTSTCEAVSNRGGVEPLLL